MSQNVIALLLYAYRTWKGMYGCTLTKTANYTIDDKITDQLFVIQ